MKKRFNKMVDNFKEETYLNKKGSVVYTYTHNDQGYVYQESYPKPTIKSSLLFGPQWFNEKGYKNGLN